MQIQFRDGHETLKLETETRHLSVLLIIEIKKFMKSTLLKTIEYHLLCGNYLH